MKALLKCVCCDRVMGVVEKDNITDEDIAMYIASCVCCNGKPVEVVLVSNNE